MEIAQRALSPGVNDPTTALYCIDRLRESLVRLAERRTPSSRRHDDEGRLRVVAEPVSFEALAAGALGAVGLYAGSDSDVLKALAAALDTVIAAAAGKDRATLLALRRSVRQRLSDAP